MYMYVCRYMQVIYFIYKHITQSRDPYSVTKFFRRKYALNFFKKISNTFLMCKTIYNIGYDIHSTLAECLEHLPIIVMIMGLIPVKTIFFLQISMKTNLYTLQWPTCNTRTWHTRPSKDVSMLLYQVWCSQAL